MPVDETKFRMNAASVVKLVDVLNEALKGFEEDETKTAKWKSTDDHGE